MVDSMILILFFYFFEIFLIYFGSSWLAAVWLDFLVGIGARMCVDIFEVITTSIPAQAP